MDFNNTKICLDVFIDHWQQVLYFFNHIDDVNSLETIFKHIDVMVSIIIKECDEEETQSLDGIMEYCSENHIFQTIFNRFIQENLRGQTKEFGFVNQLRMFDNLINFLPCTQLMRSNLISAVLHLLRECALRSSVKIEHLSVHLLYQLTVLITRDSQLFEFIKEISTNEFHEPFYFIGLIIQLIHRDKDIGRLSQEALLLIFNFTKDEDSDLVDYICYRSDFSAILVTGLSGLYSSFPRKLDNLPDDWQQITRKYIGMVPELKHSLEILDFCNLALKMGHEKIKMDILDFLYTGFLSPVIGPSLHQNSLEETISATAYLELYLRHLRHPLLIKLFLQFILTERQENYIVLDSLINRLNSITMLGVITLSLFRTMLSFHSEDVLFALVFRYLIPCDHQIKQKWVQLSPVSSVEDISYYANHEDGPTFKCPRTSKFSSSINENLSNSAEQFLKLSLGIYSDDQNILPTFPVSNKKLDPITLEQRRTSQSPLVINNLQRFSLYCPFHSYLHSAALFVNRRILASHCWQFNYDGTNPSTKIFEEINNSFDQWNQKFQFSHHIKESKETITEQFVTIEADQRNYSESPDEILRPIIPIRDVGYFSSNNGSGSTLSNRQPNHLQPYEPSASKIDSLCQPLHSAKMYKLNFFNFDSQIKEVQDDESCVKIFEKTEINTSMINDSSLQEDINEHNVILTTHDDCTLSDFLVSLDLLEIRKKIDWNVNWDEITLLLVDHRAIVNLNYDRSSLTSISPAESSEEVYESTSRSTPTNEVIFKRRLQSFDQSIQFSPNISNFSATLGPFLSAIFHRLSALATNSPFMNLLITGIITDLASYPQPLIKSLLLDIDIILQPNITKLYDILTEVKNNIMEKSSDILGWEIILVNAYEYLYSRIELTPSDGIGEMNLNFEEEFQVQLSTNSPGPVNNSFFDFDSFSRRLSQSSPTKIKEKRNRKTAFGLLKRKKKDDFPQYRNMEIKMKTKKVKGVHQKLNKFRKCDPVTCVLMWSVNYSLSQLRNSIPKVILLPDDFRAFLKVKVNNHLFDRENLPDNFRLKEYCPLVFQKFRQLFLIDNQKYLDSFIKHPMEWLVTDNKTSSKTLTTFDNNFLVKTIGSCEVSEVHRILLDYYEHIVSSRSETLLPNYLFMYRITLNDRDSYFIGMKNVFDPFKQNLIKYELRGVINDRQSNNTEAVNPSSIMNDFDFRKNRQKIFLNNYHGTRLIKTLESDLEFLQCKNFTNYGLLIGISQNSNTDVNNLYFNEFPSAEADMSQVDDSYDHHVNRYAIKNSDKNTEIMYYIGIINLLKQYGMKQKTEETYKNVTTGVDTDLTTMKPEQYGKRILDFVKKSIVINDNY